MIRLILCRIFGHSFVERSRGGRTPPQCFGGPAPLSCTRCGYDTVLDPLLAALDKKARAQ